MVIFLLSILTSVPDSATFELWSADPLVKVFPDTPAAESKTMQISCAKNEYQSGQFAITARERLEDVTVQLSELAHESGYSLPEGNVSWNFVGYVPLKKNTYHTPDSILLRKAPADFPDPLLEDRNITIEAGKTQSVWVTVFAPEDAPAGIYRGEVSVLTSEGEGTLDISLEIYPFALPDEQHLLVTLWFSSSAIARFHNVEPWSDEFWEVMGRYAENMGEHGQNVVQTSFPVITGEREDGTLEMDYTLMDRWVELFEKAGACRRIEFPALAHAVREEGRGHWDARELALNRISIRDQETGETVDLPQEENWAMFLADLDNHLQERGWQDKAMIHISDEPTIYKVDSYCRIADFIHQHGPHMKIIEAIETTGFGKCLDVWVPKLSHFMNWYDEFDAQRKAGTEMWFYTCCHPYGRFPNRFIDFALIKTRLLFWLNWKYRLDGYLHWGLNHWTADPFKDMGDDLPPGDRFIIYPGENGPMSSIRWEASREGLQDYEYLWLLAEKIRKVRMELGADPDFIDEKQRSDEICRSMVYSFTEYETDPQKLRAARELLAQEIVEMDQHPLILVQTTPQAEMEVEPGPILILVRGIVEKGATVKVQGEEARIKADGTFAAHAFVSPGREEIIVEAEIGADRKLIRRHFVVKD